VRIGIVCPYSFEVPGGVQSHVRDLAETLIGLGHQVSVLAPADDDAPLPPYLVSAGRAVPVKYNGSVARLSFGPISAARVRRWLAAGKFDVLHVHEPVTPSLALLAVLSARGPVVATFHTAMTRSRAMAAAQGVLQVVLERITGRIAVSALARKVQVEHLGGGAVEIPNGVAVATYASAEPLPGWPGESGPGYGGALGFVGRFTEPRKGFAILREAFVSLATTRPGLRLLVVGRGDEDEALEGVPDTLRDRIVFLGMASDGDKARMLRSVDIYVAPNTGGESFGMVLTEAMAAGAPVVASDLEAFRPVLDGGRAGVLFPNGDAATLAQTLETLLDDPQRRATLTARATEVVAGYDWPVIAARVLEVYTTAIEAVNGTVSYEELPSPEASGSGAPSPGASGSGASGSGASGPGASGPDEGPGGSGPAGAPD
jgi:phosphatidylinositol alpha-mannosyltransferase